MKIIRHFTATTCVVHENKALLHFHKKLNIWLPVGGHVNENEAPHEAAIREVKEESGLEIELYSSTSKLRFTDAKELASPMRIVEVEITPTHKHIDFVYYARPLTFEFNPKDDETTNLGWYTKEQIEKKENTPQNIKATVIEALEMLKS